MHEKILLLLMLTGTCFIGCATKPSPTADVWADAAIIAEQAAVIESQRQTLRDMGESLESVRSALEDARENLDRARSETTDIRELFRAIDAFVRDVIDAERQLEILQPPDRGTDAGT